MDVFISILYKYEFQKYYVSKEVRLMHEEIQERDDTHPYSLQKMSPQLKKIISCKNYNLGILMPKGTFIVHKTKQNKT